MSYYDTSYPPSLWETEVVPGEPATQPTTEPAADEPVDYGDPVYVEESETETEGA